MYRTVLQGLDHLFGWILRLPAGLVLPAVAVLTSLLIVLLRKWSTDQPMLTMFRQDRKRLGELLKAARRNGDKEAAARYRVLVGRLGGRMLGAELKPLLAAILPVALLATWCVERLAFLPPMSGQTIEVRLYHPVSAVGTCAHVVPVDGIRAEDGWIQQFEPDVRDRAVACWRLTPERAGPLELVFSAQNKRFGHPIHVGMPGRTSAVLRHGADLSITSQIGMTPRRLFGVVPGLPALGIPDWLAGYLLLAICLMPVTKRVLRVW